MAVVCGSAAAIGVNQMAAHSRAATASIKTQTVVVAAQYIRRGKILTQDLIQTVDWPAELVPRGAETHPSNALNRAALSSIVPGEPILHDKLAGANGSEYISTVIEKGMRAYTIQTTGPSSSVAGFVRPGDRV